MTITSLSSVQIRARPSVADERLSALMDGEIHDREIDRALRDLRADDDLSARWARYHLASDSLRDDLATHVDPGLADRIGTAIAAEPVYIAAHHWLRKTRPQWLRQAGGLALAASLTAVTILGSQALLHDPTGPTTHPNSSPAAVATAAPTAIGTSPGISHPPPEGFKLATYRQQPARDEQAVPAPWARLNQLMLNHQESQAKHTLQGSTLPYVRLVTPLQQSR
jgi:sigma-E factor negative regulatory protein RseA